MFITFQFFRGPILVGTMESPSYDIPEKYLTIPGKFSVSNATSAAAAPPVSTDFATILQLLAHPRY